MAVPSFKTRGDYLALITLAFLMIVKSLVENIDYIGGPRGIKGMREFRSFKTKSVMEDDPLIALCFGFFSGWS